MDIIQINIDNNIKQVMNVEETARKVMAEAFNQFDTDKSGTIEIFELGWLLKRLTDSFQVQNPTQQDINIVFRELDANGDGKISKKQFQNLVDEIVSIVKQESMKCIPAPDE